MSKLLQLRYYVGEESSHDKGYGVAPGNIASMRVNVVDRFSEFQFAEGFYLINKNIIEIPELKKIVGESIWEEYWGQLAIRLIGPIPKEMKKTTKLLDLPFSENLIVPYALD